MRFLAPLLVAVLLVGASAAHAQDGGASTCPTPTTYEPEEFFPASSGGNVATDVAIRVRYTPGSAAAISDPPSTLVSLEVELAGANVPGTASWVGDTVVFRPAAPLATTTRYSGTAVGPDATMTFGFTTGIGPDTATPTFSSGSGGIRDIASSPTSPPPCDVPDGAYRIDVTLDQAVDDGAPGDIEYLLYVSRAANVHAPTLVARMRNFASTDMTIRMSFVLPLSESTARVCVVALAVDDAGHVAQSNQRCVDPIEGNYFEPLCSVTAARPVPLAPGLVVLAPLAALVVAARRAGRRGR